jgi:membrane-bound inhibitor of C-type lysozyme
MTRRLLPLGFKSPALLLVVALAGCAAPARPPANPTATAAPVVGPDFSSQSERYRCAGGTELEVAYLNLPDGLAFAALHHNGRTTLLQNRPAASGARYVALDEQLGLRWHTKGSEGFLAFLAADHTAREQVLLGGCRALPPR